MLVPAWHGGCRRKIAGHHPCKPACNKACSRYTVCMNSHDIFHKRPTCRLYTTPAAALLAWRSCCVVAVGGRCQPVFVCGLASKTPILIAVPARSIRLVSRLAQNLAPKSPRHISAARLGGMVWGVGSTEMKRKYGCTTHGTSGNSYKYRSALQQAPAAGSTAGPSAYLGQHGPGWLARLKTHHFFPERLALHVQAEVIKAEDVLDVRIHRLRRRPGGLWLHATAHSELRATGYTGYSFQTTLTLPFSYLHEKISRVSSE